MALGIGLVLTMVSQLAVLSQGSSRSMEEPSRATLEAAATPFDVFQESVSIAALAPPVELPAVPVPPPATAVVERPVEPAVVYAPTVPSTFTAPPPIDLSVLPLSVRTIVLDPGHGGKDAGTVASQGVMEKDVVLDISKRLGELLEQTGFQVLLTRTEDQAVSLAERAAFANQHKADLFVSIHLNWIEGGQLRGVETYHLGPTKDPRLLQLAARENQASGYSLADFRRLLDSIYLAVRQGESRRLADAVQGELFGAMHPVNPSLINRGVKTAPFVVLAATEMPAILAEVSCLSNAEEALLLATPAYRQQIAQALFQGLQAYAQSLHSSAKKGN